MSETPSESTVLPNPLPEKDDHLDDCNGGESDPEAASAEPRRMQPDDLGVLLESLKSRPTLAEHAKAWVTLAERVLLFVLLVFVIWTVGYVVFRETRTPVLVIEPFEVPETFANEYGLTGRALAQMLRGEMTRISTQVSTSTVFLHGETSPGSTQATTSSTVVRIVGAWENITPDITVPGTGLTLDSVLRYTPRNETRLYGALLVEGNRGGPQSLRLHMHVSGRPDFYGDLVAPTELKAAIKAAAIYTFRNTQDFYYASVLIETDAARAEVELRGILEGRYVGERNDALNGFGLLYERLGRYDEAIASYQRAIALDPEDTRPRNGLGNIYARLDRYDEAIASYERAIKLKPEAAAPHNGLGIIYARLGRYDEAIASYQRAIALNLENADPYNGLGIIYTRLGRYDEAIASYQRALVLEMGSAYLHNNLGTLYAELGRYEEAIASYQRAIDLDPEAAAIPYNGLGNALRIVGQYDEAISSYQSSIALDTAYSLPQIGLGSVYYRLEKYDEALASYLRAIEIDPMNPHSYRELYNIYKKLGRYDDAEDASERANALDSMAN